MKNHELNELAKKMMGDSARNASNFFFVSLDSDYQMITTDFDSAYLFWKSLVVNHKTTESLLEDRKYGKICSVELWEEDSKVKINVWDDSESFKRMYPPKAV